jgi:hypothetical protein
MVDQRFNQWPKFEGKVFNALSFWFSCKFATTKKELSMFSFPWIKLSIIIGDFKCSTIIFYIGSKHDWGIP